MPKKPTLIEPIDTSFDNLAKISVMSSKTEQKAERNPMNNYRTYSSEGIENLSFLKVVDDNTSQEHFHILPKREYTSIELFAGAGGLALGLEKAGIKHALLNELDKHACNTLRANRPNWNVVEGDVSNIDFNSWKNKIDIVTGGFPCQTFSYAGKKLGFNDTRGTMFYEFARCVKETQPQICIGENVRGLLNHDGGRTLESMVGVLEDLGYDVIKPQILRAVKYKVPQKRERLIIVGIKRNSDIKFEYPKPHSKLYSLKDALKEGELFATDVPITNGQTYPKRKREILDMVPKGGYWRDLPLKVQKEYMLKSFYLGGGRTGMARRMSWDEPSLTLTCAPAQKQTERCHPDETRPFQVREYARIQTFPDDWSFEGSMTNQYKQIGNAVPVNLAYYIGQAVVKALNKKEDRQPPTLKR
jgi:DNA (cytosine-5)-methyltransferase 1